MKYMAVAALVAAAQAINLALEQTQEQLQSVAKHAQIKSHPVSRVQTNLQKNYFTQLLSEKQKKHVCDYTAKMNKDPDQPSFEALYDQLSASDPWTDPWFHADDSSLAWADAGESWDVVEGRFGEIEWRRISKHYDSDEYSLFGSYGVTPYDIAQGSIGNCWVIAALSAIAEKPERIENMFLNDSTEIEEKGVYGISMYALGVPYTVLVDDYIPMKKSSSGRLSNLFSSPKGDRNEGDNSLWGSIIEKAFAKFYGNYYHIEGGWSHKAIEAFVGGPYELIEHYEKDNKENEITDVDTLWERLMAHDLDHEMFGANPDRHPKNGIVSHHAYTTLGVTDAVPGQRLVHVRNPWGDGERYTGPWCDECAEWDGVEQEIKDSISFTAADDGAYWMTVEDYHDIFRRTIVNYDINDGTWFGDHYLYLNDEDRRNSEGFYSNFDDMTKHEFTLTNTATEAQKVYAAVHTWDGAIYSEDDPDCDIVSHAGLVQFNYEGASDPEGIRPGTYQEIFEMQPGEVVTGWVEFNWFDDQAQDWSITTWAQSGKVEVALTSMPDRPSDQRVELSGSTTVLTPEDFKRVEEIESAQPEPEVVIGEFVRNKPEDELEDWHYATISVVDANSGVYRWTTGDGHSWKLNASFGSPDKLKLIKNCPVYFCGGKKEATLKFDADGKIYAFVAPNRKVYYLPYSEQVDATSDDIVGEFVRNKPQHELNDGHFVDISVIAKGVYRWTFRSGRSCELTKDPNSPDKLNAETNCPYNSKGDKKATLKFDADDNVYAILFIDKKIYYKPLAEQIDSTNDPIVAEYVRDKPEDKLRDYHYANISIIAKGVYRWSDRAGASWELFANPNSLDKLDVDTECPYYNDGHTQATLLFDADGDLYAITGPYDNVYYRPYTEQSGGPPDKIVGDYVRDKEAHKLKDYHYVEISAIAKGVYRWTNGRGRTYTLTQDPENQERLKVSKNWGRGDEATLKFDSDGNVEAILGPYGSRYRKE